MAKRYSHRERQQHLDAWQQSGLTKQHYCRQHDLNPATFYYLLKHHHDDATVTAPAAFIPARRVMPGNTVTLNLPNGCSVCYPRHTSTAAAPSRRYCSVRHGKSVS
ncbi:IS66 family insertion sequence element accessory protein TnpA [Brenneria goodwinii]|uniref:IS66 family insertion sequence element accessory protein TnpA n=1 Tax=Brenneria goodwinii TaxID=1109412 RepID=UPI0036EF309B